ncbi:hypothetical protein ACMA1I_11570 [Pontibacter sp. 13R65]|uniref:hypothetical protein n=1 Tax=Pontibacter sp. 13R65 TaxID=3127458 RepID=UPI00301E1DE3
MEVDTLQEGVYEFSNSYLHLIVDEDNKLLYSEWTRQPTGQEYRDAASVFAVFLQESKILYWIQDTSNIGAVTLEDMKWVMDVLIPVASHSALRKLARITCHTPNIEQFKELAHQSIKPFQSDIEVRHFKSYRDAADWIEGISDAGH